MAPGGLEWDGNSGTHMLIGGRVVSRTEGSAPTDNVLHVEVGRPGVDLVLGMGIGRIDGTD